MDIGVIQSSLVKPFANAFQAGMEMRKSSGDDDRAPLLVGGGWKQDPSVVHTRDMSKDEVERLWEDRMAAHEAEVEASADQKVARDHQLGLWSDKWNDDATFAFKDFAFSIEVDGKDDDGKATKEMLEILQPVSGCFSPGNMVAIMGPSGCGKSTLLDMMACVKSADYEGDLFLNGHAISTKDTRSGPHPLGSASANFKRIRSYVEQADTVFGEMTVTEAVTFNQMLKGDVPQNLDAHEQEMMKRAVQMILKDLCLEHVADKIIGTAKMRGISGGQKRRVTLARGLASMPHLCFLDEPTSGLSSTDAEIAIRAIAYMCHAYGMLAFIVIHQPRPEVARLFDHCIMLTSKPGRCVYNGPMNEKPNQKYNGPMAALREYIEQVPKPASTKTAKEEETEAGPLSYVTPGIPSTYDNVSSRSCFAGFTGDYSAPEPPRQPAQGRSCMELPTIPPHTKPRFRPNDNYFSCPAGANPLDFFMDVISPDMRGSAPESFVDYFEKNEKHKFEAIVQKIEQESHDLAHMEMRPVNDIIHAQRAKFPQFTFVPLTDGKNKRTTTFCTQIRYLFWRQMIILKRDPSQGYGIVITMLMMGILNSIVFQGLQDRAVNASQDMSTNAQNQANNMAFLFQILMIPVNQCLTNLNIYAHDKTIVVGEIKEGLYSLQAYTLGATLSTIPLNFAAIFVAQAVAWLIATGASADLISFGDLMFVYVCGIFSYLAIDSLFQFWAFFMNSGQAAMGAAMPCFSFLMLFNGFAPSPKQYQDWIKWAVWTSPSYYSMSLVVDHVFIEGGDATTELIAKEQGFKDTGITTWMLFVAWIVVFRIAGMIALGYAKQAK